MSSFEKQHGLSSTVDMVARLNQPSPDRSAPVAESVVHRRSKLPKGQRNP